MERTNNVADLASRSARVTAHAPQTSLGETGGRARLAAVQADSLHERRVVLPGDASAAANAYRMLRTRLLQQMRARKLRSVGVVSAVDGEGKTLTAVNLALSIATEPNQSALLVDLDLRRPGVADLLGLGVERGLEAWFEEGCDLSGLFVGLEGIEDFRVLPTARAVPGSSELLASARAAELLEQLEKRYSDRLIIVDLPPVLLTDDFLTLAPHLDAVLVIISEGYSRREDTLRLAELLAGVPVLGSVLNRSSEAELRAY